MDFNSSLVLEYSPLAVFEPAMKNTAPSLMLVKKYYADRPFIKFLNLCKHYSRKFAFAR